MFATELDALVTSSNLTQTQEDDIIISLIEIIQNAKTQLNLLNYAEGTKQRYILKSNHFLKYDDKAGDCYFSKELGIMFLQDYYGIRTGMKLSVPQAFTVRAIKVLGEMLEYSCFLICHQKHGKKEPHQFEVVLNKYEQS